MPKIRIKVEDIYPITTVKFPDHDQDAKVILDVHIQEYTPPYRMASFEHAMRGQTRSMLGVYPWDVEVWLNGEESLD